MKYRVVNVSTAPVSLPFSRGAVTLKKRDDSAEVELPEERARSLASHGVVRFEALAEKLAPEPKPEPRKVFAPRDIPVPADPPPASQPAADEPAKETR